MTGDERSRVFVLGAGFSKRAGLPLASELRELLLKDLDLWSDQKEELDALIERLGPKASPEQVVDELRSYESAWWRNDVPRRMEGSLPAIILGRMPKKREDFAYVVDFVGQLDERDCVLTFNYDLLVELALGESEFSLGFEERSRRVLHILKLHGSVDWLLTSLEGKPAPGISVLYEDHSATPSKSRLLQVRDQQKLLISAETWMAAISHHGGIQSFPTHIGFGVHKGLERIPGLMNVWQAAERRLSAATEVYVIGYSMPSADCEARDMVVRATRARQRPLRKLVILDPSDSLDVGRYERAFGCKANHLRTRAEEDLKEIVGN